MARRSTASELSIASRCAVIAAPAASASRRTIASRMAWCSARAPARRRGTTETVRDPSSKAQRRYRDQLGKERIPGGAGDGDVEFGIQLVSPIRFLLDAQLREDCPESRNVLPSALPGRQTRGGHFEATPHRVEMLRRIAAEQKLRLDAIPRDEGAAAVERGGEAKGLQADQRLAHHRPTDAERAGEPDLGRQLVVI